MHDVSVFVGEGSGLGEYDDDAVLVQQSELSWIGGAALDSPDRALVLEDSTATVEDVALSSGARAALHIVRTSSLQASGLRIEDAGLAAFVQNSSLMLSASEVARTAQISILGGAASEVTLLDSTFADSPAGFVAASLDATSLEIRDSRFLRASADNCITASAGALTAVGNTIDGCSGSGISAIGIEVDIQENDIRNIDFDRLIGIVASAISLTDATGLVRGNTIAATLDAGITSINSATEIRANIIGPVEGAGISHVDGPAERSTFAENQITSATGAGIIVLNASADVTENIIDDTKLSAGTSFGDGVVFGSFANVSVQENMISASARSGILYLNGAQGDITGNTATANGQYGISELCIDEPNQVTVGANTLAGNTAGESQICSD